jgi:hypothetical protein
MSSSLNEMLQDEIRGALARVELVVQAERELAELYALAEGPANKKQRLELPAIVDDSTAAEDAPLVLRKAKAKATAAEKAARKARKAARVQAEVKAVLEQLVTRVCKVKANKAALYARQRQAAEAEAEQPGDFDDDHEDLFGEPVEAEQPAVLFAQLCERVWSECFGLGLVDIRSAFEPRYYVDGTWNVTEMQSDFALSRGDFVATINHVVRPVAQARQALEAEAAERVLGAWLRFEDFFDQIFEVVAPKSARVLWGFHKVRGEYKSEPPWTSELLEKMRQAGLPEAEACGVKGRGGRKQTEALKKWLEEKDFKPGKRANKDIWYFALKTGPVQQA